MWLYFIIGILFSQFVTFIIFLLSKQNEEIGIWVGCGIFMLPIDVFLSIIKLIRKWYIRKFYVAVRSMFDDNTEKQHCNNCARIKRKWFNQYYHKGENKYYIELSDGKYVENVDSLKNVSPNGWWTNDWIKENLMKKS